VILFTPAFIQTAAAPGGQAQPTVRNIILHYVMCKNI
jgi:hypothetical protein